MRKVILAFLTAGTMACSGAQVIRDAAVYETEIQFADNVVAEQHAQLRQFIDTYCLCGEADMLLCNAAVETWVVVESRWGYHTDMMRYNGKITEEYPGDAPEYVDYPGLMEADCE